MKSFPKFAIDMKENLGVHSVGFPWKDVFVEVRKVARAWTGKRNDKMGSLFNQIGQALSYRPEMRNFRCKRPTRTRDLHL